MKSIIFLDTVAIIKLHIFKGYSRENYREYSSEIWYLYVSEHAKVKYAETKSPFSAVWWRCALFQCSSTACMLVLSPWYKIKTRLHWVMVWSIMTLIKKECALLVKIFYQNGSNYLATLKEYRRMKRLKEIQWVSKDWKIIFLNLKRQENWALFHPQEGGVP